MHYRFWGLKIFATLCSASKIFSEGSGEDRKTTGAVAATKTIAIHHKTLGNYHCYFDGAPELLFCDNDTNGWRLYGDQDNGFYKDAFHDTIIHGIHHAVSPQQGGTKAAAHFNFSVPAHGKVEVRVRLSKDQKQQPFNDFEPLFTTRRAEADAFYAHKQTGMADADAKMIQRQAFAGMIWSKQFYYYDIP